MFGNWNREGRRRSPPPFDGARPLLLFAVLPSNNGMAAGSPPEQLQRSMKVRETVQPTEKEERIFQRLLDVVRHFDLGTQLRVAGGWVRDKVISFSYFLFWIRQKEHKGLGLLAGLGCNCLQTQSGGVCCKFVAVFAFTMYYRFTKFSATDC